MDPIKGEGGSHGSHQGGRRKSWIPSRGREEVMDPIKGEGGRETITPLERW